MTLKLTLCQEPLSHSHYSLALCNARLSMSPLHLIVGNQVSWIVLKVCFLRTYVVTLKLTLGPELLSHSLSVCLSVCLSVSLSVSLSLSLSLSLCVMLHDGQCQSHARNERKPRETGGLVVITVWPDLSIFWTSR